MDIHGRRLGRILRHSGGLVYSFPVRAAASGKSFKV